MPLVLWAAHTVHVHPQKHSGNRWPVVGAQSTNLDIQATHGHDTGETAHATPLAVCLHEVRTNVRPGASAAASYPAAGHAPAHTRTRTHSHHTKLQPRVARWVLIQQADVQCSAASRGLCAPRRHASAGKPGRNMFLGFKIWNLEFRI